MTLQLVGIDDEDEEGLFLHSAESDQGLGKVRQGQSAYVVAKDGTEDFGNIEDDWELLPDGNYLCQVSNSELRATKAGGHMLTVEYTVVKGSHEGRKLWKNFNVVNQNPKAVAIAMSEIKDMMRKLGLTSEVNKLSDTLVPASEKRFDTQALHGLTLTVQVSKRTWNDQEMNDVVGFQPASVLENEILL